MELIANHLRHIKVALGLLVACVVLACAGCRSKASPKPADKSAEKRPEAIAPVSPAHLQVVVSFIKHDSCAPSSCAAFRCEPFSAGQTMGLPSHIVRCWWTDTRAAGAAAQNKCAYVHYSEDAANQGFKNLFLSARAPDGSCALDKEFAALIKDAQGYSGQLP